MRKIILCSFFSLLLLSRFSAPVSADSKEILSPVYTIDRIYKSMEGPQSSQKVTLMDGPPELVWITGFRTEMVGADGVTPALPEFMCHVNLDFDVVKHFQMLHSGTPGNGRILTLSQGQITVHFPDGFGMPVLSNEPLSLATQVLNHNIDHANFQVRHKLTFDFIRDRDLKEPLKPLFNTSGFAMKLLEGKDGHFGIEDMDDSKHGPSCLPGDIAPNAHGGSVYTDGFQKKFIGHWIVKPGREVNHSNVTKYLNIPYDTTLHYAAVHLHPYAESLELRDLTTGKSVFKSKARGFKDKIGLVYVDSFSSQKGVPLYKNHEYDLVSVYNNTTSTNKDSMAVMLLFALDKKFHKPTVMPSAIVSSSEGSSGLDEQWIKKARESAGQWQGKTAVLKTTLGDIWVQLDPKTSPATVAQFSELVNAGAYNGTKVLRVMPGFVVQFGNAYEDPAASSETSQKIPVHRLPLEPSGMPHVRGVLSMARNPDDPNSAQSSFCILLGNAPQLDGHYTAFGKVERGMNVLDAIEKSSLDDKHQPREVLRIEKAGLLTQAEPAPAGAASIEATSIHEEAKPATVSGSLRLQTSLGDMTFKLYPEIAPQTVAQFMRLVRAGVYDSVPLFRIEPGFVAQFAIAQNRAVPLTVEQQALLRKLPAEFSALHHRRGILSMAREDADINSGVSSFSILLGDAPHLDGKYTIFGELVSGENVLSAIEKAPRQGKSPATRIEIKKAEILGEEAAEAPSCHPNEGAPMPEGLTPSGADPSVIPTDKPVMTQKGMTAGGEHYKTLVFKGMEIDKLYPSMRGPWTRAYLTLDPAQAHLWITGYKAEVLDGENGKASQEFMCHTKFDQVSSPQAGSKSYTSFFVISQGLDEIRFPDGFGLWVDNSPDRRYDLNVMVLNNNYPDLKRKLDFKATITYLQDAEAKKLKTKSLAIIPVSIYCPMDPQKAAPGQEVCLPASPGKMEGPNNSTGHWLVPKGRHTYRYAVNLALKKDTTVHYIMAHLHPHAESVELRDVTTGLSVWKGNTVNDPNPQKSLLLKTDYFSSVRGKPVYRDHQYEVTAIYNNTTSKEIDAMASFWIYVRVDPV